ncbi:T9SS type A sorting domain-containing protein [Chryseobacterium sp. KACC 21268]|nr:T9SS type A sorting domain-containing protein [Chryseobacterium sp. KACC 21268]
MKHQILFSALFLLGWGITNAQSSSNSSGGSLSGTDGSASYSLGNVFYKELSGGGGSTEPGTQVPYIITSTLGVNQSFIRLEMAVYPNPITDYLYLKIDFKDTGKYTSDLYDTKGSLLQTKDLKIEKTEIPMSSLPPGVYFLSVRENRKIIKTFKIIKK